MLTISGNSIQVTSPDALQAELQEVALNLDPNLSILPASFTTQILESASVPLIQIERSIAAALVSLMPSTTNSQFFLDQFGEAVDVQQKAEFFTSVEVEVAGVAGTYIPNTLLLIDTVNSQNYKFDDNYIIDSTGSVVISAYSESSGKILCPANSITKFSEDITGVTGVAQPVAGIPGNAGETLQQYQARLNLTLRTQSTGFASNILSRLMRVKNVQPLLVAVTQPSSHTILAIVGGGDRYEIAQALYESVLLPSLLTEIPSYSGNENVQITDGADSYMIKFSRPQYVAIKLRATWRSTTSSPSLVINDQLLNALYEELLSYTISPTIYSTRLISVCTNAVDASVHFDTITFELSLNGIDYSTITSQAFLSYQYIQPDITDILIVRG